MTEDLLLDAYARVSRLGDARQRSTQGQVADCVAIVKSRGARVGEIHVDEGRSAWRPNVRRPAWDRMMDRLERAATGGVIVFDLARFSRRPIEGERLITLADRGLVVLDSEGEYDLTSASGRKAFRDQLAAAAYESDRLSTRVKRGKKLKSERGESNRGNRPYGYGMDWQEIPDEAEIIRELVRRLLAGEAINELTRDLNARQVPSRGNSYWTNAGIRQLVLRPSVAGLAAYRGTVTGELVGVTPIVPRDQWERITAMFAARGRGRPPSSLYLMSGIIECGLCGTTLNGIPKQHMRPYPDGEVRRHYYCHLRDGVHGGCGRTSVDMRDTDSIVRLLVANILADPRHASAIAAAEELARDQARSLDTEIEEAEQVATELAGRLGRGEITLARFDATMTPLDRRLADLRRRRAELTDSRSASDGAPLGMSLAKILRAWDGGTTHTRRQQVRQALRGRRIVVAEPVVGRLRSDPTGRVEIPD